MKTGTLIAIVVLAGYLGMEAYAFRKASHRMEPAYIHDLLVKADAATLACDSADPALQDRFEKTFARVTDRYRMQLADENPDMDADSIDQLIEKNAQTALHTVNVQLDELDCTDLEMRNHAKRYAIYAKKTR